jgi:hypothetical protein
VGSIAASGNTLSNDEWKAASLYLVFAFRKVNDVFKVVATSTYIQENINYKISLDILDMST